MATTIHYVQHQTNETVAKNATTGSYRRLWIICEPDKLPYFIICYNKTIEFNSKTLGDNIHDVCVYGRGTTNYIAKFHDADAFNVDTASGGYTGTLYKITGSYARFSVGGNKRTYLYPHSSFCDLSHLLNCCRQRSPHLYMKDSVVSITADDYYRTHEGRQCLHIWSILTSIHDREHFLHLVHMGSDIAAKFIRIKDTGNVDGAGNPKIWQLSIQNGIIKLSEEV